MSAALPWAMLASFSPFEGSNESKYSPAAGVCHAPLMKRSKRRLWRSSQEMASLGSSGAGPYSMLTNFSAMLMGSVHSSSDSKLCDRMTVVSRISSGDVVLKLPLDVAEQSAGAKAKHFGAHPGLAQFFFDQGEPVERLLRGANAAGRLEAYGHAGLLCIFADGAKHD